MSENFPIGDTFNNSRKCRKSKLQICKLKNQNDYPSLKLVGCNQISSMEKRWRLIVQINSEKCHRHGLSTEAQFEYKKRETPPRFHSEHIKQYIEKSQQENKTKLKVGVETSRREEQYIFFLRLERKVQLQKQMKYQWHDLKLVEEDKMK